MKDTSALRQFILQKANGARKVAGELDLGRVNLFSSGILDSISFIELLVFLEKEFDIKVAERDLRADYFDTLDSIVALISRYTERSLSSAVMENESQ